MKKYIFYQKYANTPLGSRFGKLTFDHSSPIFNMSLTDVYSEIHAIDEKLLSDEIRREKLLETVEPFLLTPTDKLKGL